MNGTPLFDLGPKSRVQTQPTLRSVSDAFFERFLAKAADEAGASGVAIGFVGAEGPWCRASRGLTDPAAAIPPALWTRASREGVRVNDLLADPSLAAPSEMQASAAGRGVLGEPLRIDPGPTRGVLWAVFDEPQHWPTHERHKLQLVARELELELSIRLHAPVFDPDPIAATRDTDLVFIRWERVPARRVAFVGAEIEGLLGLSPEAVRDGTIDLRHSVVPEDLPRLLHALAVGADFDTPVPVRMRHARGHSVPVEVRMRADRSAKGDLVAVDAVLRRLGEPQPTPSRPSPPSLADLADASPLPLLVVHPDLSLRYSSEGAREAVGGPADGQLVTSLIHEDDVERVTAAFNALLLRPGAVEEIEYRSRDEPPRVLRAVGRCLLDDPSVGGILASIADITAERRRAQALQESRQQAAKLAAARAQLVQELEEARRRRSELMSLVIHDLKNPLAVVQFNAEFMKGSELSDDDRECVEDILTAARNLNRLVLDLLDVERGRAGQLVPQLGPLDLGPLLQETVRMANRRARGRDQPIGLTIGESALQISADEGLVRRVLQNLVDNACKYAGPHGDVQVQGLLADDHVVVRVVDDGPGVPDAMKRRIFDPYVRVEESEQPDVHRANSHGLGLVFCRQAVEAHGGTIQALDAPGGGCLIEARLPRR